LFRYNDAIIRNLIIRREKAITEESLLAKSAEEKRARKAQRNDDGQSNDQDHNQAAEA
jgi:small subunit ribosomal protein S6